MPRISTTADQATIVKSSSNQVRPEIEASDFIQILENIGTTFSRTGSADTFWTGAVADKLAQYGVYWATRSAIDGYDVSKHNDLFKAIAGWMNDIGIGGTEYHVDLTFTKGSVLDKNLISLEGAKARRLMMFGADYGSQDGQTAEQAIRALRNIVPESEESKRLESDAKITMENHNSGIKKAWANAMDMLETEYPDATISDFHDVDPVDLFHMMQRIEEMFSNISKSARNKASLADLDNPNSNIAHNHLERNASAKIIAAEARDLIKHAEQVHNSNTSQELMQSHMSETHNLEEPAGFQHKDYNEGYVTP